MHVDRRHFVYYDGRDFQTVGKALKEKVYISHLDTKPIKIGLGDTFWCPSCEVSYQQDMSHL